VANPKIYIHDLIDIRGHARAKYMHHMNRPGRRDASLARRAKEP
jgi:hypothetical protein